jgi:hypothetical protein
MSDYYLVQSKDQMGAFPSISYQTYRVISANAFIMKRLRVSGNWDLSVRLQKTFYILIKPFLLFLLLFHLCMYVFRTLQYAMLILKVFVG